MTEAKEVCGIQIKYTFRCPESKVRAEMKSIQDSFERANNDLANARKDAMIERDICTRCNGLGHYTYDARDTLYYITPDYRERTCEECNGKNDEARAEALYAELDMSPEEQAICQRYYRLSEESRSLIWWETMNPKHQSYYGVLVEVFKGRKVPKGTIGVVFWQGESQYGWRFGLRVEGQKEPVWVAADNCQLVYEEK